jgi:EAL domain-containing protein (putative c-di-GMP-specific phosphodiesterase class I)
MRNADAALYKAKDAGRNNYQYYGDEMRRRVSARVDLETELRRAVEREEFVLHYQPRISLVDNGVIGAEALLRWKQPNGNVAEPGEFLHVLEENGMMVSLGTWVYNRALADLAHMRKQGHKDLTFSINVSRGEFERDDFVESLECALAAARLPQDALEIEITEELLTLDSKGARRSLDALGGLGVKLVVDNFGRGAIPLLSLKRAPVRALKVSRVLVAGAAESKDQAAVISAAVALADSLQLEIGADGVEDAGQLDLVKAVGLEHVQGFHISRPRPLADLRHFVATWSGTRTTPPPGQKGSGGYKITPS